MKTAASTRPAAILLLLFAGFSPLAIGAPSHTPFFFKYETSGADAASSVVVDEAGNSYVLGAWTGTADFDPEHGPVTQLTSTGTGPDLFISSYTRDGTFRWVKSISAVDATLVRPASLCFAGDGHDLYVSGSFFGELRLPTAGGAVTTLTNPGGGFAGFVARLDLSGADPEFEWGIAFRCTGSMLVRDLCQVRGDRVAVCGEFWGVASFNSLVARVSVTDSFDAFLAVVEPHGEVLSKNVVAFGGSEQETARSLDEGSNRIVVVGGFDGTVDFDPGVVADNHTAQGSGSDGFFSEYEFDTVTGLSYIKTLPLFSDAAAIATAIDIHDTPRDNAWIGGNMERNIGITDDDAETHSASIGTGNRGCFVMRLSNNEGDWDAFDPNAMWSTGSAELTDVLFDISWGCVACGSFDGAAEFDLSSDPVPGSKFASDGTDGFTWINGSINSGARTFSAQRVGGSRDDMVSAIAASSEPGEDDDRRGAMVTAVGQFTGTLRAPRFPSPLVAPPAPADVFVFRQHLWPLPELGVAMLPDGSGVELSFDPVNYHSYLLLGSPDLSLWNLVESYEGVPYGTITEEVVFGDPPPEQMFYRLEEVE